ncbi:MAG: ParB/RepB/Spo0J family partition protein [Patescibacteria group bacterium]|nr:ParB/RepB/Spo0J family partition protein [Patescibacteria group bacterium]MDD5490227.1 ParB/RepB/Spo0J family partition protein [Patescibacteria group bacterium]
MSIRGGLGRGLSSLIPSRSNKEKEPVATKEASFRSHSLPEDGERIFQLPVTDISPNPAQPRQDFGHQALEDLVNSIKEHGIIQPLIVTKKGEGYELVTGERRLRAAKIAGLKKVPAIIRTAQGQEKLELALIENVQRQDLNPMEEAVAYKRLSDEFGLTQEEVAKKVGKSRPVVANSLRLLSLPEEIKKFLRAGKLSESHARIILQLPNEKEQLKFVRKILKDELSVRASEEAVRSVTVKSHVRRVDSNLAAYEEELRHALGAKVNIKKSGQGGRIVIEYYSEEELSDIISKII